MVTYRRARVPSDAELRETAQRHLEGRRQRLEAYARWLRAELVLMAARPGSAAHRARLASQLQIVRRQCRLAARRRLPRDRAALALAVGEALPTAA